MNKTLSLQRQLLIVGIPLTIIFLMVFIAKSSLFTTHASLMSIGITIDLLLTAPFVYFLLIRKTSIPKTTMVPFLILSVVVCSVILPVENQYYLNLFKTWILPIVELVVLSHVIYTVRKGIVRYKLKTNKSVDFFTHLKGVCLEIMPKRLVIPVSTEIAVFYYGFINWGKSKVKDHEFTYHKNSGTIPLLIAIIGIVAIETITVHSLLAKWNNVMAWIFTSLSIYSGIQLFGFLKSMLKRPLSIEHDRLYLRYGIMTESTIELTNIKSIELSSKDLESTKKIKRLSFFGALESHNVIIHLRDEVDLIGLYGIQKKYKDIALFVDDKKAFKDLLERAIQK